jgi:hypothetical protein
MTIQEASGPAAFNALANANSWPLACDPTLTFESGALADVLAIWRGLAKNGIPHRRMISARMLKPHLGYIGIVERVPGNPPRYCVRLMGTRLSQLLGEMQGKMLDEALPPDLLPRWQSEFDLTLAELRPLRFTASRVDRNNLTYMQSETLLCPLLDENNAPNIVFAALILKAGTAPAAGLRTL